MNKLFANREPSSGLRAFLQPIRDWIANGQTECRDTYFAQAADLPDLERRIIHWERSRDRAKLCY